jgi:hypothetical protein
MMKRLLAAVTVLGLLFGLSNTYLQVDTVAAQSDGGGDVFNGGTAQGDNGDTFNANPGDDAASIIPDGASPGGAAPAGRGNSGRSTSDTPLSLAKQLQGVINSVAGAGGLKDGVNGPDGARFNSLADRLNQAQRNFPPEHPRPTDCWAAMIGAWVQLQQGLLDKATAQAQTSVDCYAQNQPTQPFMGTGQPDNPLQSNVTAFQNNLICNLQDLAALIFGRYGTGHPIAIVPLLNKPQYATPSFLVLISGTETTYRNQTTQILPDDTEAFIGSPVRRSVFTRNLLAALRAAAPATPQAPVHLFIAGHSLGGMAAQDLVIDRGFGPNYIADRITTFGAPHTTDAPGPTQYLHVEAAGDPILLLGPPWYYGGDSSLRILGGPSLNPIDHHLWYPRDEALSAYDVAGNEGGVECYQIDANNFHQFVSVY